MHKIEVAILGATGTVGQKFIALLQDHPWFTVAELAASSRSAGKAYREACAWKQALPMPDDVAGMQVLSAAAPLRSGLLFSGLDSSVAGQVESDYAAQGHLVISNARNHRLRNDVPLVIPEINSDHFALLDRQPWPGGIVTNSNCSTMFLAMALAPLHNRIGITAVHVTTLQAISGAGYPGVASLDIVGNVIPYIADEEHKMERETLKILGVLGADGVTPAPFTVSAHCTRVPVCDGHTETLSVGFAEGRAPTPDAIGQILAEFTGPPQEWRLPSAPQRPLVVLEAPNRPQPLRDLWIEHGMATVIGRIRACPLLDVKMVIMGHNTVRGAAGAAILNAEALYQLNKIDAQGRLRRQ